MSGRIDKTRIPQFIRTWGLSDDVNDQDVLNIIDKYLPSDPIFYLSGSGDAQDNKLNVNITKAEIGRLPVSTDSAENAVKAYTEMLFSQVEGYSVTSSSIENGKLNFIGSAVKEIPEY